MTRKLRVLSVINELYFGGDENRLLAMARAIDREKFDLAVVTLKRPDAAVDAHYGTMRDQYRAAGVDVIDLGEGHPNEGLGARNPLRLWRASNMFVRSVLKLCRLIRDREIDVIDAHLGPGNLVGVIAGSLTGTPRVVTTYHVEQWSPHWLWYVLHQWTLARSDAIITDSDACADTIRRWMRKRDADIVVIPNGVVPPSSDRPTAQLRALFGLPTDLDVKIVGQISTLLPTKGHGVLIEAARIVQNRRRNTAFLIVGYVREDPSYKDRLEARIAALQMRDSVRIVSYPGPIGDVWSVIDVHAHPTLLDSLPNAIIEGMSLGRPSVVTSVGGIPTLVADEVTGLVVQPNDAEALADALLRILDDAELARRLGQAAQRRYADGYTQAIMARRLEALFSRIAAKSKRAAPARIAAAAP